MIVTVEGFNIQLSNALKCHEKRCGNCDCNMNIVMESYGLLTALESNLTINKLSYLLLCNCGAIFTNHECYRQFTSFQIGFTATSCVSNFQMCEKECLELRRRNLRITAFIPVYL